MSWNATVDRLRARAQHHDLARDEYTRRLLYQAVDEITRLATDRIGGPTTVVRELESENQRLRVEVKRLTDVARWAEMQTDQAVCVADEGIAEVERLTADLAAARADFFAVADRLGTVHEPDMGPRYPGSLNDVLCAIDSVEGERDHARAERDELAKAWRAIVQRADKGQPITPDDLNDIAALAALSPKEDDDGE